MFQVGELVIYGNTGVCMVTGVSEQSLSVL